MTVMLSAQQNQNMQIILGLVLSCCDHSSIHVRLYVLTGRFVGMAEEDLHKFESEHGEMKEKSTKVDQQVSGIMGEMHSSPTSNFTYL